MCRYTYYNGLGAPKVSYNTQILTELQEIKLHYVMYALLAWLKNYENFDSLN